MPIDLVHSIKTWKAPPLWREKPYVLRKEFIHGGNCVMFTGTHADANYNCPAYISRVSTHASAPPKFDIILLDDLATITGIDVAPDPEHPIRACLRAIPREEALSYVNQKRERLHKKDHATYLDYLEKTEQLGF